MKAITASLLLVTLSTTVVAQSNYKEGSNSFARYTQTGDMKQLESAKKFSDATFASKKDSLSSKNNMLRALVYSSLAYADSTRKVKTDRDPIDITLSTIGKLKPKDRNNYESELNYVTQNLTAAYIYKANKAIQGKDYEKAYNSFLKVEQLGAKSEDVLNNLALLAAQAGKTDEAIGYYNQIIQSTDADAGKYLALATLYELKKDQSLYLQTIQAARNKFQDNKKILFLLIQNYAVAQRYAAITPIIDEAIKYEPENTELLYLAGFANESEGNVSLAKKYYAKVIDLDENNYDANLAMGLIFLNQFLKDKNNLEAQYSAQEYLLKANGIQPYAINALKGLAMYYEAADDLDQLDRVNVLLNQLSNN
ncbi:tetratricopeptide repeat protein [Sphingobacterium faecale]|uniref:Tetratricopeptide repeat protein n=1 Tax=Sphingobacterium faecale TaxID=2803775 RepID=A0ABS1QY21_9SPHI|nr:hypothetical protein [Sphingobacterium faecale]MBL1407331.1 hypothetical protein [Sphingobacterium faecale]